MRSELEQLEQIDQYLSGKMSASEVASFEQQMNADPALKSMVTDQEILIQTVARKALMAEINAVAGITAGAGAGAAAGWGITQWLITSLAIIGAGVGGYFIYDSFQNDELLVADSNEMVTVEQEVPAPDTGSIFSFALEEGIDEYEIFEENDIVENNQRSGSINSGVQKGDNKTDIPTLNNEPKIDNKALKDFLENDEKVELESQQPIHSMTKNRKATFPGGIMKMKAFFKKELRYPRTPKDKGLSGTVKVTFLVSADGKLAELDSDCFIMKDEFGKPLNTLKFAGNGKSRKIFEDQAERIFRISAPWTPATNSEGNPVLSEQTWYVNFDQSGESSVYQLEEDRQVTPSVITKEN